MYSGRAIFFVFFLCFCSSAVPLADILQLQATAAGIQYDEDMIHGLHAFLSLRLGYGTRPPTAKTLKVRIVMAGSVGTTSGQLKHTMAPNGNDMTCRRVQALGQTRPSWCSLALLNRRLRDWQTGWPPFWAFSRGVLSCLFSLSLRHPRWRWFHSLPSPLPLHFFLFSFSRPPAKDKFSWAWNFDCSLPLHIISPTTHFFWFRDGNGGLSSCRKNSV